MPRKERNYAAEYAAYGGTPAAKKARAQRNAARREAIRDGLVKKGDGMDVDHIVPISKGGSTSAESNRRVVPRGVNRSFSRTSTGALKSQTSARERKR